MTQVERIDLGSIADLDATIENLCTSMRASGFRLASTFVFHTELVLIFQS